jgi:hypothetical protein
LSVASKIFILDLMPAPKHNKFWKLRSSHGRKKLFENPELMLEAGQEYFEWCDKHPLIEEDFRGKDLTLVKIKRMRPYTMQGLCLYLDCNTKYFAHFKQSLLNKKDKNSQGFSNVITYFEETVYNQKYSGAAAGFLNANLISRDLGLKDATDITSGGDKLESGETFVILGNGTKIPI